MLLAEYTPRKKTLAYRLERFRVFLLVQAGIVVPVCVGFIYFVFITETAWPHFSASIALLLGSIFGILTGGGTSAIHTYLAARFHPWLRNFQFSQKIVAASYRMSQKNVLDAPFINFGEGHPTRKYRLSGDYKRVHHVENRYSLTPEWVVLPAKSLVTGLLVYGGTGAGKTSSVLRNGVFQMFHHFTKPGGLVMDSKGSLVEPLIAEMDEAGRREDILPIGPWQTTRWNPLHAPLASPATIAQSILTTIENANGAPYDSSARWIRAGAAHLSEALIGLILLKSGYVTCQQVRKFLSLLLTATSGAESPGSKAVELVEKMFAGHPLSTDLEKEKYAHYCDLLSNRFSEDSKFLSIYVAELGNFLVPLTSPDVCEIFNPSLSELNMPSWAEAIDRGLMVVLDCNSRQVPGLSIILGTLLKLGYQDAMLSRLGWQRKGLCNSERYMCLIIDEYQNFASHGDAIYLAECRESKSISVFLTQGHASLEERLGEAPTKVILQSARNRFFMAQDLPEAAADLLGKSDFVEVDRTISETQQNASLAASGRFAGESSVAESLQTKTTNKHVVSAKMLASIPSHQGILQGHDGDKKLPLQRVYCIPFFERGKRHADIEARKDDRG